MKYSSFFIYSYILVLCLIFSGVNKSVLCNCDVTLVYMPSDQRVPRKTTPLFN